MSKRRLPSLVLKPQQNISVFFKTLFYNSRLFIFKMKHKIILSLLVLSVAVSSLAQSSTSTVGMFNRLLGKNGQGSNASASVTTLTSATLQKATLISYVMDSGSLPPEYQWTCSIKVMGRKVMVKVTSEYGHKELYNSSKSITSSQFDSFKQSLLKAKVGRNNSAAYPGEGSDGAHFAVWDDTKTIFEASDDEIYVQSGQLLQLFFPLLTPEMKRVVKDPESLI